MTDDPFEVNKVRNADRFSERIALAVARSGVAHDPLLDPPADAEISRPRDSADLANGSMSADTVAAESLQILESQVAELDRMIRRLEQENDRLRRENHQLVHLLGRFDAKADKSKTTGRSGLLEWLRRS